MISQKNNSLKPTSLAEYPGGKGLYASRIAKLLPSGIRYLEPYAGMANVFAKIPDGSFNIYVLNDIDSKLVTMLRHLQDREKYDKLKHRLLYTLYSQEEFALAIDIIRNPNAAEEDVAWAFFVKQNQGFSGIAKTRGNWGRSLGKPGTPIHPITWQKKIDNLNWWHKRLMGAYIDNRDSLSFIDYWDADSDSVFYLDPPYVMDTRVQKFYANEVTDEHHVKLTEKLCSLKGRGILSCYDHPVYYPLLDCGWKKESFNTSISMASKARGTGNNGSKIKNAARTETMYIKDK